MKLPFCEACGRLLSLYSEYDALMRLLLRSLWLMSYSGGLIEEKCLLIVSLLDFSKRLASCFSNLYKKSSIWSLSRDVGKLCFSKDRCRLKSPPDPLSFLEKGQRCWRVSLRVYVFGSYSPGELDVCIFSYNMSSLPIRYAENIAFSGSDKLCYNYSKQGFCIFIVHIA